MIFGRISYVNLQGNSHIQIHGIIYNTIHKHELREQFSHIVRPVLKKLVHLPYILF